MQHAICKKIDIISLRGIIKYTTSVAIIYNMISNMSKNVKTYPLAIDSQITNARKQIHKSWDHVSFFKFTLKNLIREFKSYLNSLRYLIIRWNSYFLVNKVKLSMLVGISEAIRVLIYIPIQINFIIWILFVDTQYIIDLNDPLVNPIKGNDLIYFSLVPLKVEVPLYSKADLQNPHKFDEWLAGLIDADGCFLQSKKGYASLEITKDLRDKKALFSIKQKYGGSVKQKSGSKAMRYRKHHKEGLLSLINNVNGKIRNPIRLLQLSRICDKYNIIMLYPKPLTYYNGWLSGFFDGDGSIYLSPDGIQITATNNMKSLLDELSHLYGGAIYITNSTGRSFKWHITKKLAISEFNTHYFHVCPSRSAKKNRINLIPTYFELRKIKAHQAGPNTVNGKVWFRFINKWGTYPRSG